jgi:ABC-2 type transport system permease protein
LEMLLTKPVTDWQILWGKFLATLLLIVIALLLTLPYYVTVANLGNADHGAIITGYLALILMSATYISIGVFTSSMTNNQIVAFLLALLIGIFFHLIFNLLAGSLSGIPGAIFQYLSISTHFDSMSRGVIDSKDLIYFGSIIMLGMVGAEAILAKRNTD